METYFSPLADQVVDNWFWLENGNQESQQWLAEKVHDLYQKIKSSTCFIQRSQNVIQGIKKNKGYHWHSLYQGNQCRAGLLYLIPNRQIPLHDHPNNIGASMVLSGSPIITQEQTLIGTKNRLRQFSYLRLKHKKLIPWDITYVFPSKKNVHGFASRHSPSLLFNIMFFKQSRYRRRFIPIPIKNKSNNQRKILSKKVMGWLVTLNLIFTSTIFASCNQEILKNNWQAEASKEKLELLKQCSKLENGMAQFLLAELYYSGIAIKQDMHKAYYWYLKAAKNGHVKAQYQVGMMLLDGKGVTEDSFDGLEWIFTSSQGGNSEATEVLNYILDNPEPLEC